MSTVLQDPDSIRLALVVALALGAAMVVLSSYVLLAVRPLRRRLAAVEARADALAGRLESAAARAAAGERRSREQLARLAEKFGQLELRSEARGFEQAINLASHGEAVEHLVSCLGLTEGEASLVSLLHGGRSRASRDGESVSDLG